MSKAQENGGTLFSEEEINKLRHIGKTELSESERKAWIDNLLSRIEENEEEITANQEKIEERGNQERLTKEKVDELISNHPATSDELAEAEDGLDEDTLSDTQIGGGTTATDVAAAHEAPHGEASQHFVSPEFRNFVRGSTLISSSLLALSVVLGIQGAIAIGIATILAGVLSVFAVGFGKTWYDLEGSQRLNSKGSILGF